MRLLKSKLVLFDESNVLVWSANITEEIEGSLIVAEIRDDGNFVLRRHSDIGEPDEFMWQSFDFPTNALLPGMELGWERRTGRYSFIRSWKNSKDPSNGNFSYGIPEDVPLMYTSDLLNGLNLSGFFQSFPAMFLPSNEEKLGRINPSLEGIASFPDPRNQQPVPISFKLKLNKEKVTYYFQTLGSNYGSALLRLNAEGLLQFIIWNEILSNWETLMFYPVGMCEIYNSCGPYGYCEANQVCNCMEGFAPKNPEAWALNKTRDGCVPKMPLNCNNGHKFVHLHNIKLPDTTKAMVEWRIGYDECKEKCVTMCDCSAFTTTKQRGISGCVIWIGELLDTQQFVRESEGDDLYVKLGVVEKDKKPHTKLITGLSVCALGCIVSIIFFCYWRRNQKQLARARGRQSIATSLGNLSGENIVEDLDLPLMSFQTISQATDNFSVSNKLGEGGFGIVYKGVLDNQEIAVKRLSLISGQGINEFKNEVMLITKLQHVNLVRLLGYCINGAEKLLVYEYLENRSLDVYLVDEAQRSKLNWQTRSEIIVGIARGLQYLHEDSAVRIIHRDLKPSNVLLDKDMTPKISDFGMARIFGKGENEVNTTTVVGTCGYMSPEYLQEGLYSVKSDVYNFGVMILEILSGKQIKGFAEANDGLSLLSYAWKKWIKGEWGSVIDPILDPSSEEIRRFFQIALLCVQNRFNDRPVMSWVIVMLVSKTERIPRPHPPAYFVDDAGPSSLHATMSI